MLDIVQDDLSISCDTVFAVSLQRHWVTIQFALCHNKGLHWETPLKKNVLDKYTCKHVTMYNSIMTTDSDIAADLSNISHGYCHACSTGNSRLIKYQTTN